MQFWACNCTTAAAELALSGNVRGGLASLASELRASSVTKTNTAPHSPALQARLLSLADINGELIKHEDNDGAL